MATNSILIIACLRCGGIYLARQLAKRYGLKFIFEPKKLEYKKGVCIKFLPEHDFTFEEIKKFDKIIILDRKEKIEQALSLKELIKNVKHAEKSYRSDDYTGIEPYLKRLYEIEKRLISISRKLASKIYYYEDLYYNGDKPEGLEFKPDTGKKVRNRPSIF